jgi:hypothetical protein
MGKYKCLAVLLGLTVLSACAVVSADGEGIEIRHSSENDLLVQHKADKHCASFGKIAVKVQESSIVDTYILRSMVTTFKCVRQADLPKPAS